ncbi:hypothetical protein F3Y22_tig00110678pilonHSYRG00108 [Hibiscus syriacus]|uniref:Uncharacterized protein n=1 Tax=Hibiscus syriacus TaxID=106335 RepID=A0A6A2ZWU5_HIBSY|nr:hypothetical protein F3Y22_tig00110678pilonHSYRG00108 [Hibiscus syriacus]
MFLPIFAVFQEPVGDAGEEAVRIAAACQRLGEGDHCSAGVVQGSRYAETVKTLFSAVQYYMFLMNNSGFSVFVFQWLLSVVFFYLRCGD